MLLSNRRDALLHVLLAGMQAAWIGALFLLVWPLPLSIEPAYLAVFGGLLAWMLALELLSRMPESSLYDWLALGGLVLVSLLLVRLVLYRGGPPWAVSWIGQAVRDARGGLPPFFLLIGLNLLLWQRASAATSRDLNFFNVGLTFRAGILLLLFGGALLSELRGMNAMALLWLYLATGLAAVAISRVMDKARDVQSFGRLLPPRRLLQVALAACVAVAASWLFSLAYTRITIMAIVRLLDPLFRVLQPVLAALADLLIRLLGPVMEWIIGLLTRVAAGFVQMPVEPAAPGVGADQNANPLGNLPRWPFELAGNILAVLAVLIIVAAFVGFLLLYLQRVRRTAARTEDEEEGLERATLGGGILQRAAVSLRTAGALIRRFGLGRELLAAISVQNIYANVCRIARLRGHPRRISQPPDAYLPALARAFPGQDERLSRITGAYMRVHYGEHPVPSQELAALREDYRALREGALPGESHALDAEGRDQADSPPRGQE